MFVEDPADSWETGVVWGLPAGRLAADLELAEIGPGESNTDISNMTMIILCLSWMHPSWYICWTVSMLKVCYCDEMSAAAWHDALISQSSGSEEAACDLKLNIETLASSLCICVGPQSVSPPGPVGAHPRAHLRDCMRDCTQRWWEVKFNWAIRRSSKLLWVWSVQWHPADVCLTYISFIWIKRALLPVWEERRTPTSFKV